MTSLQALVVHASALTTIAHGLPVVPVLHMRPVQVVSPHSILRDVDSTATRVIDTVLTITKEAAQLSQQIPYLRGLAGTILEIIKIKEDIQSNKERCEELIEKVLQRSQVVLDGLLLVMSSPSRNQLKGMEAKLTEYKTLLMEILQVLKGYTLKSFTHKILNRISGLNDLNRFDRLIDNFNMNILANLVFKINVVMQEQANRSRIVEQPSAKLQSVIYKPVLPPPPALLIGRDLEKSQVIEMLLNQTQVCVAILGAGGIGKTALALSILHNPQVVDKYQQRYFVSCEGISSIAVLLGEVANTLRIPLVQRDVHLYDTVLSALHQEVAVLCFDNFETMWEDEAIQVEVEELLSHISNIPQLSMIITMRGTQRPSGISWSKPLLPPLQELGWKNSTEMFQKMECGPMDEFVEGLLKEVDGIPLAIRLVGSLLQEGNETSQSLLSRWKKIHTKMMEVGGKTRLSNLDASIHLSVYSPRMQADRNAIGVLRMLSLLPDGFPEERIDDLQDHLQGDIDLHKLLQTIKRASLVHRNGNHRRLYMLSPIRFFCQTNIEILDNMKSSLLAFYIEIANKHSDWTSSVSHMVVPFELLNMHAVFLDAYIDSKVQVDDQLLRASITYTQWSQYVGKPVAEIMEWAIQRMPVSSEHVHADCLVCLSEVYLYCDKLNEAEGLLLNAIDLDSDKQAWAHSDVLGKANVFQSLGDLYLRQSKLDEAEVFLKHAIDLYKQVHSVLGEANVLNSLGDLYIQQSKLDEAEVSLKDAVDLQKQAQDGLGEAKVMYSLGYLYLQQCKLPEAEVSLKHAVDLYKQTHSVLGEADVFKRLGELYLRQDRLNEAEASLKHAVNLHKQAYFVLGEANDLQRLGNLYMRQSKLDKAEVFLKGAVDLHKQAHSVLGEANDLQHLGVLHLRQNRLKDAEVSLMHAVDLHKQAHYVLGEANDFQSLGDLYLQQDKLDEAEVFLKHAIDLYKQANSILGEANVLKSLGDLYVQQSKIDEAEVSLKHAINLHKEAHSVLGEANDLQSMGNLYLQQSKLDQAEVFLKNAVDLHKQAQDASGKANDLQRLGDLYLQWSKLDEAEVSLKHALELHHYVQDFQAVEHDQCLLTKAYS